jgi:antitoxin component of MazEF toxin-antitoxin module
MSKRYESKVLEICENGDAIIELPPELCEEMGWKEGTTLDISLDEQKRIILKEVKNA